MSDTLTVDDIRSWIMERCIADNDIDFDLVFSDEEIMFAMQSAAREYNSIPPMDSCIQAHQMHKHTNQFFDGTAAMLYTHFIAKLMRNDMEYSAGGVTTRIEGQRIEHLKFLIQMHMQRFTETVKAEKLCRQIKRAYGHY